MVELSIVIVTYKSKDCIAECVRSAFRSAQGLSCEVIDSFRLHTDIDEKEDLVELLIHGRGKSRAYLEELGFVLTVEKGRVGVERKEKTV